MHTLCLPSLETERQGSQTAAQTGPSAEISTTHHHYNSQGSQTAAQTGPSAEISTTHHHYYHKHQHNQRPAHFHGDT